MPIPISTPTAHPYHPCNQAATFLHCLHTMHGVAGPFLLVVPLSTLQHWQRELDAWTTLHSIIFHGNPNPSPSPNPSPNPNPIPSPSPNPNPNRNPDAT